VELLSLLIIFQAIGSAQETLVDLGAQSVPYAPLEFLSQFNGTFHTSLVGIDIFNLLAARYHTKAHQRTGQGTARLRGTGYTCCEGAAGHEPRFIPDVKMFLQTCKYGLRSAGVFHITHESSFLYVVKQLFLFLIIHRLLLSPFGLKIYVAALSVFPDHRTIKMVFPYILGIMMLSTLS
jgi:hypothetical protein